MTELCHKSCDHRNPSPINDQNFDSPKEQTRNHKNDNQHPQKNMNDMLSTSQEISTADTSKRKDSVDPHNDKKTVLNQNNNIDTQNSLKRQLTRLQKNQPDNNSSTDNDDNNQSTLSKDSGFYYSKLKESTFQNSVHLFTIYSLNEYTYSIKIVLLLVKLVMLLFIRLRVDGWVLHWYLIASFAYMFLYVVVHLFLTELVVSTAEFERIQKTTPIYEVPSPADDMQRSIIDHYRKNHLKEIERQQLEEHNQQNAENLQKDKDEQSTSTEQQEQQTLQPHEEEQQSTLTKQLKMRQQLRKVSDRMIEVILDLIRRNPRVLFVEGSLFLTVEFVRSLWVMVSVFTLYTLLGRETPVFLIGIFFAVMSVLSVEIVSANVFTLFSSVICNYTGILSGMIYSKCSLTQILVVSYLLIAIVLMNRVMVRFMKKVTSFAAFNDKQMSLVRSEHLYRELYMHAPSLFIMTNPKGIILNVNHSTIQTTGYSSDELVGHHVFKLLDKQGSEFFVKSLKDHVRHVQNVEFQMITKSGEKRDVIMGASFPRIGDSNEIECANLVLHDITQTKVVQKELEVAKERAEASSKAKSSFVNTISHEIRTPAFAISALAEVLLLSGRLNSEEIELVQTIRSSSDLLRTIISDLLDLSKIEHETFELEHSQFDLQQVIYTLKKSILDTIAKAKNLSYSVNLHPDTPTSLVGDMTRLIQVLINLTNNAIKFTDTGFVNVYISEALVDNIPAHLDPSLRDNLAHEIEANPIDETKQTRILFIVEDSGMGIPQDKFGELFKRFSQLTRSHGGTGLGLAISKSLTELMHGHIFVSSQGPGHGSTFYFTAVFERAATLSSTESSASRSKDQIRLSFNANIANTRVLLVEDNLVNTKIITRMLIHCGLRAENIDTASNGKIACQNYMERHYLPDACADYDIILMDLNMPEMDGYDATRFIRKFNSSVPIVALTADASHESKELCMTVGMNEIVTKPFTMEQIQRILHKYGKH